jgi:hypothetical protein
MACCAEGGDCPMHKRESRDAGSGPVLTQVEADTCCAASEGRNSTPPVPASVAAVPPAILGPGVVMPPIAPASLLSDAWRTPSPLPATAVPKHVLLSVFLL